MSLSSELPNPEANKSWDFYPMASDKPFTPIAKGRLGDPYYHPEAHTRVHSLSEGVHKSLIELSSHTLADSAAMKKGVQQLNRLFCFLMAAWTLYNTPQKVEEYLNYDTPLFASLATGLVTLALLGGILASEDPNRVEIVARKLALRERLRLPDMPNNPCQMRLTDEVFNACMKGHSAPQDIIDPVTQDVAEDPVMFLNEEDSSMTIFSRKSAEELLKAGLEHPITRKKIVRAQLVELPELKLQIGKLKEIMGDTFPAV